MAKSFPFWGLIVHNCKMGQTQMVTEEAPSSRTGSVAEMGLCKIVEFEVTRPIHRGETETSGSCTMGWSRAGLRSQLTQCKTKLRVCLAGDPCISSYETSYEEKGKTCPGSHCQGLVLLGLLDAQEPYRVGVTVPAAPSSKQ